MDELVKIVFWSLVAVSITLVLIGISAAIRLSAAASVYSQQRLNTGEASNNGVLPYLPEATVILSLRGVDPFLPQCLEALLHQNYPSYQVHVVIDSREDEAWDIVTQTLHHHPRKQVKVSPLRTKRQTCSLKCSALIQAISELDVDCEVVALVDADTMTHPNWLRELVNPLCDPTIGATTGNRWYIPDEKLWGSLVRYLGNVASVVHMDMHCIPWGGSLAIKRQYFDDTRLLEHWSQALAEDVLLYKTLKAQGAKVKFVPSLIIVNREQCNLWSYLRWMKRQLLCVRLYHPSWPIAMIHGIVTVFLPILALGLMLIALFTHQWNSAIWAISGVVLFWIVQGLVALILEQGVQKIINARREKRPRFEVMTLLKLWLAIPLAQVAFMIAILWAAVARHIDWRGINYEINSPWDIRLVEYQPYRPQSKLSDAQISVL
jgi:cellulose synthase/poly-beta-1,6-N-acetylglucosamine synthase-like glycosyltransferase